MSSMMRLSGLRACSPAVALDRLGLAHSRLHNQCSLEWYQCINVYEIHKILPFVSHSYFSRLMRPFIYLIGPCWWVGRLLLVRLQPVGGATVNNLLSEPDQTDEGA